MSRKRPIPNHNWSGVKVSTRSSKVVNESSRLKKKSECVHGFITRNHASTIVRERKTHDGKIDYDYIGQTHDLPKAKQATIAKLLDNPNVSKVVLYDEN